MDKQGKVFADIRVVITEIEGFALHDGPGIRTTVFFKGCPLRCYWCANPETQRTARELLYDSRVCVCCGACVAACPHGTAVWDGQGGICFLRDRCVACGACGEACPTGAISYAGQSWTIGELTERLLRDKDYYINSGGGVTLSGGEPFFQPEAAIALLQALKAEGIHTAVETAGMADPKWYRAAAPYTDLFLLDIKHADPDRLLRGTGCDFPMLLAVLAALHDENAHVIARIPVIPGFNDEEAVIRGIYALALRYCVREAHLLPYHPLGKGKYQKLGREYPPGDLPGVQREQLEGFAKAGRALGLAVQIGG